MTKHRWSSYFGGSAIGLTVGAAVVVAAGLLLARYDLIPKLIGFSGLLVGGLLCGLALLAGSTALVIGRGGVFETRRRLLMAMLMALLYIGFMVSRAVAAGTAPAIHDITTALADPPRFEALTLRPDNLIGVGSVGNWQKIHASAYPDLHPQRIAQPVAAVLANARSLALAHGWAVARFDPARGRLEATASVSFIRFQDDVVVTATPQDDGRASLVNMRSVSRVGIGDLGVNARRIREFMAELAARSPSS